MRQERLSPLQMKSQIRAVRDLVTVAHQQLVTNQIDRDTSSGLPIENHRFDAFFSVPDIKGIMRISSHGLPDAQDALGLFVDIDYRNKKGKINRLVEILTAKVPEVVGEKEALWLSGYTPKQLRQITKMVRTANSITARTYQDMIGLMNAPVPEGLEV